MKQDPNSPSRFAVQGGEQVTVTIEAIGCSCLTGGAFDGDPLSLASHSPDTYTFAVPTDSDEHAFTFVCHFLPGGLPNPKYAVSASGNQGGGSFRVAIVFPPANPADPPFPLQITFVSA